MAWPPTCPPGYTQLEILSYYYTPVSLNHTEMAHRHGKDNQLPGPLATRLINRLDSEMNPHAFVMPVLPYNKQEPLPQYRNSKLESWSKPR
jgi:hypothetical protein